MERLESARRSNIMGVYGDETFVLPRVTAGSFLKRETRKGAFQLLHTLGKNATSALTSTCPLIDPPLVGGATQVRM